MKQRMQSSPETDRRKCSVSTERQRTPVSVSGSYADAPNPMHLGYGNRVLKQMLASGELRAKLKIGQPNDIYEQEADRVAEQVMRMPEPEIQAKSP